jgi:hypothetical protein
MSNLKIITSEFAFSKKLTRQIYSKIKLGQNEQKRPPNNKKRILIL